jgi:hypothetical protein
VIGITAGRRRGEKPADAPAEEVMSDEPTITDAPVNRMKAEVSAWMGGCGMVGRDEAR